MTPAEFNAATLDLPLLPLGSRRSEAQVSEVLAANEDVAIGQTAAGKYVAAWRGHMCLAQDEAELRDLLNAQERALLPQ